MIKSMTGFASLSGARAPHAWAWELRAVNGKGLDLRLRVPDWIEGLEAGLRKALTGAVARGNVTLSLRITREEGGGTLSLNEPQAQAMLRALHRVEELAMAEGISLAPSRPADILAMRGVLEQQTAEEDGAALAKALLGEADQLISDFNEMRAQEGRALQTILLGQLEEVLGLVDQAEGEAAARAEAMRTALARNLARVLENSDGADPDRVTQELALIAVKADITEELDRLRAHVAAARALIGEGGPVGRKLDFLMQEFNREANTLCSKAQMKELTATGLALKALIDQMREQVQNVE